eukprot:2379169-Alexandrium_andersonii.AAC.1
MSASLVGSEMCIRDSAPLGATPSLLSDLATRGRAGARRRRPGSRKAVSYTHLTLPTICSV